MLNNRVIGLQTLTTNHTFQHCVHDNLYQFIKPSCPEFICKFGFFALWLLSCFQTSHHLLFWKRHIRLFTANWFF